MRGALITFEGSEGSGKSTQIDLARQYLESTGKEVFLLREPGGVRIGEKIREILLDPENIGMGNVCETLLYMAARAQMVEEALIPALRSGKIILCDRFLDSTIAYQGYGNGGDIKQIRQIGIFATQGCVPDLTFVFDIDAREGLARIDRPKDRIEMRNLEYHNRVRRGYLEIAKQDESRVMVIDATKNMQDIQGIVRGHMDKLLSIKKV